MYLTDYHTHTCCSMDSQADLSHQAAQAEQLGIRELCTTDHCDLLQESGERLTELNWEPILLQHAQAQLAWRDKVDIRLGLELGCAQVDPDCARRILSGAPLDFVIGSIHNQSPQAGGVDFYFLNYRTHQDCRAALDDYFASMWQLVKLSDCYDVLGHIIYPLRYMKDAAGPPVTLEPYWDILREIFSAAVYAGRGIELNTYCGRTVAPWRPVLELYRQCGGEIITIGSDAHTADNIGKGIRQARQLLLDTGFRYQSVYRGREAQFIRL